MGTPNTIPDDSRRQPRRRRRADAPRPLIRIANRRFEEAAPIDQFAEHPQNPNVGAVDLIAESLDAHGFVGAIVVQESSNRIIAGNHRWRAMKAAGATSIPAIIVDVSDDEALQLMLMDNKAAREGHNDEQMLADVLAQIAASEDEDALAKAGYSDTELEALLERLGRADTFADTEPDGGVTSYPLVELVLRFRREQVTDALRQEMEAMALRHQGRLIVRGARADGHDALEGGGTQAGAA
jgi:ParB-like chromosome segregation protein Spo0J